MRRRNLRSTQSKVQLLGCLAAARLQVCSTWLRFTLSNTPADWIRLISDCVKPAIPDFSWSHLTTGEKDEAGYSVVKLQVAFGPPLLARADTFA